MNPSINEIKVKVISDIVCNNIFRNFESISNNELDFSFSPVDQFISEILIAGDEDFLLVHISQYAFGSFGPSKSFQKKIDEIFAHLEDLIKRSNTKLVLNTIFFNHSSFSQEELVLNKKRAIAINRIILDFVAKHPLDCILVDIENLISSNGFFSNISSRNYGVMKFPYSKLLSKAISEKYFFHFKSYLSPRKKVIFVDADNTLWGGIVGEDGLNGVKIGNEYPGSVYYYFQSALLRLKKSGVVLCLVTKNNYADIEEIFSKREMPLSIKDFTAIKANWEPKSKNIGDLLTNLNVGESSTIFIDDNPFELEEVASVFTEIKCQKFSITEFDDVRNVLSEEHSLYAHLLTKEDKEKSKSYAQEGKRKKLMAKADNLEDYLKGLLINITVHLNDAELIPRISQLCQKTNQFNLTTKRHSISAIEKFMQNSNVYAFSVNDRFGDLGVIGTVIVSDGVIDTFLLSCRAFGRHIEREMLKCVLDNEKNPDLKAQFLETKKNEMTREFYEKNGFTVLEDSLGCTFFKFNKIKKFNSIVKEIKWHQA